MINILYIKYKVYIKYIVYIGIFLLRGRDEEVNNDTALSKLHFVPLASLSLSPIRETLLPPFLWVAPHPFSRFFFFLIFLRAERNIVKTIARYDSRQNTQYTKCTYRSVHICTKLRNDCRREVSQCDMSFEIELSWISSREY